MAIALAQVYMVFLVLFGQPETRHFLEILKPKKNKVIDKVSSTISPILRNLLVNNQADTIKTLPKPGVTMDPVSYCDLIVKRGALTFNRRFEMSPFFSSQDTLHPLFVFVKKLLQ